MTEYLPFNPLFEVQHQQMQFFLDQLCLIALTQMSEEEVQEKGEQIVELLERVVQRQTNQWVDAGIPEGLIRSTVNTAILAKRKKRLAKHKRSGEVNSKLVENIVSK